MNLEYLRHGKALCGKVFGRFVETFNFHNDFISNLKGDADQQVVGGKINIDRTDERHPVIRCRGCGGGQKDEEKRDDGNGRYAIVSIEDGVVTMKNTYFSVGGKTYQGDATTATLTGGGSDIVALQISAGEENEPTSSIVVFESFAALQGNQFSLDYYIIPLYMISTQVDEETEEESYSVDCDFRIGPDAAMGEY